MTIAEKLKTARKQAKLTRNQIFERYNIPVSTLVCWERGERIPPDYVVTLLLRCMAIDFPTSKTEQFLFVQSEVKAEPKTEAVPKSELKAETIKVPTFEFYDIFGKPLSASSIETVCRELENERVEFMSTTPQKDGTTRSRCKCISNGFLFNLITKPSH